MAGFVKTKGRSDGGDTIKSTDSAAVEIPSGGTAARPAVSKAGDLRFNTDTSKMEYYDGSTFTQFSKEGNVAITQDSFTGDGSTTAFTMSKAVTSNQEQRVLVAVGNVYQNPASAYTVVGTTITFTSPPGGSETIVVIHGFDSTTH
tara:strand:- start:279 stop:716 length:438 start_codon:yes stop_codon:yes gene_type:complete